MNLRYIFLLICMIPLLSACQSQKPISPKASPSASVITIPTSVSKVTPASTPSAPETFRDQLKQKLIDEVIEVQQLVQTAQSEPEGKQVDFLMTVNDNDHNEIFVDVYGPNLDQALEFAVRKDMTEITAFDPIAEEWCSIAEWRKRRAIPPPTPDVPRPMPKTIDLSFAPLELEDAVIVDDLNEEDENFIQRITIGHFKGKAIRMNVYENLSSSAKGCFTIEKQTFCEDELSANFNEPKYTRADLEYIRMDQWIGNSTTGYYVLGGVETFANGPGCFEYFIYEAKSRTWKVWNEWSEMTVTDLDGDGTKDMIMQFPGLHNDRADVFVARLRQGKLERSYDFQSEISAVNEDRNLIFGGQSFTAGFIQKKKDYQFEFCANLDENKMHCDVYRFKGWQLQKVRSYID